MFDIYKLTVVIVAFLFQVADNEMYGIEVSCFAFEIIFIGYVVNNETRHYVCVIIVLQAHIHSSVCRPIDVISYMNIGHFAFYMKFEVSLSLIDGLLVRFNDNPVVVYL